MSEMNVVPRDLSRLPNEVRIAQEAINLPEVQAMLRKLSAYNLGICMPHIHDEQTGQFMPLPKEVIQVETDLQVSFQSAEDVLNHQEFHLPVGWVWHDGDPTPMWAHTCVVRPPDTMHYKTLDTKKPKKGGKKPAKGSSKSS